MLFFSFLFINFLKCECFTNEGLPQAQTLCNIRNNWISIWETCTGLGQFCVEVEKKYVSSNFNSLRCVILKYVGNKLCSGWNSWMIMEYINVSKKKKKNYLKKHPLFPLLSLTMCKICFVILNGWKLWFLRIFENKFYYNKGSSYESAGTRNGKMFSVSLYIGFIWS